jgi:hypothetical protein
LGSRIGPFALRAGRVKDKLLDSFLGIELAVDGGQGAEKLIGDVSEDRGFARGDAILGEKEKQASKEVVDGDCGAKFSEIGGERCGGIGRLLPIFGEAGVAGAEGRVDGGRKEPTTLAIGEAMGAAS